MLPASSLRESKAASVNVPNAGLEPEEEEKAGLEHGSKVGGWLTPSFILVFNSARSDTSLGFLAEGEIPGKLGMYRG